MSSEEQSTPTQQPGRQNGPDIVGALILLTLGTVLLLNNFNVLPWGVWGTLWRFWPLFLILPGLQLLLGRSIGGKALAALLALVTLASVIGYAVSLNHAPTRQWLERQIPSLSIRPIENLGKEVTTTLTLAGPEYANASTRSLTMDIGAAELTLSDGDIPELLTVSATHPEASGKPLLTDRRDGTNVALEFTTERGTIPFGAPGKRSYQLVLGQPTLPTDLTLTLGAGQGTLTLSALATRTISAEVGAGTVTVELSKTSLPHKLKLDVGAGSAIIRLPKGIGINLRHDVGAGRVVIDGQSVERNGQYRSSDSADTTTVEMDVDVGAGRVTIERQ